MHQETPPAKVASNDQLGRANEAQPLVERLRYRAHYGIAPMHELARLDMLAAAAEIERLRGALRDYLAAADAAWVELCQEAARIGLTSMPILPGQAKSLEQYNKLRQVFGA